MAVLRQPRHRRPSFMQTPPALHTYLQSDFARKQGPTLASESDSFSYNPVFLENFQLPLSLSKSLPPRLVAEIGGWQAAGAAVITTIRRLQRFDDESLYRGWPIKKTEHLSRASSMTRSNPDTQSPPRVQSPLASCGNPDGSQSVRLPRLMTSWSDASTASEAVTDTPPFTPDDAKPHPFDSQVRSARASIDPLHLGDRLQPLTEHKISECSTTASSPARSPVPLSPPVLPQFDEASWEVFVNQYAAELENLRKHEIVRFRHIRRGIDKMVFEMETGSIAIGDDNMTWKGDFSQWWADMGVRQQGLETDAQAVEVPDLEQVKLERVVQGLVI